jgi:two-component system, LytTR family, response regulator LytT
VKVIIIEDELPAARQLTKLLTALDPSVTVIEVIDSVEASVRWFNTFPAPDAVFMDIQIADGLSFDIFNHVTIESPVVFTTAFDQYAVKAFKVNAVDYLLKPIESEELETVLDKLKRARQSADLPVVYNDFHRIVLNDLMQNFKKETYKERFLIKAGQSLSFVNTDDIAYFFSDSGLTQFCVFQSKKHSVEHTLDELESLLNPKHFFRINRKIIVNAQSIQKISPHFNGRLKLELMPNLSTTEGGIFVARERVNDFKTWLGG